VQAYLDERLSISLDGGPPGLGEPLPPVGPEGTPAIEAIAEGEWPQTLVAFPFRRPIASRPERVELLYAVWPELGPTHTNLTHIEEAGGDELEVVFTEAEPDFEYYTAAPSPSVRSFGQFVTLGMKHIWAGLDHVLFLVALLVVSRLRELIRIVTSFTVAHSITLGLAALDVVRLPSRWVEAAIALTLVWVAVENVWQRRHQHRWRLTFGFGLVHGFGFASVLRELDPSSAGLVRSLAGFNVGVELGQLALVLAVFPIASLLARSRIGPFATAGVSLAVGLAGVAWLVDRTVGLPVI
jgi:hypothetical protein